MFDLVLQNFPKLCRLLFIWKTIHSQTRLILAGCLSAKLTENTQRHFLNIYVYMLAFVQTSRICQHVLGRLDVCPNILKYQDVQTCISKRPEIPGRLDVRLNVLVFQDVYTYFLGCLDVNSKLVLAFRDNSSFGLIILGPLCLWQCF